MSEQTAVVKEYLARVEKFSDDTDALAKLVHADVSFVEYPNLINKKGQVRNLEQALKGIAIGRQILAWQKYEVMDIVECRDSLLAEAKWSGQIAADVGHLKKDQLLTAYSAMRFDFKDGRIIRQVNYDCYEPF